MRTHTGSDSQTERDTAQRHAAPPNWPVALASVGICLGTGGAIALIAILA
jgi:hypothetical protein